MLESLFLELESCFPGHRLNPVDKSLSELARKHLDNLTKPPGSLGRLEDIATQIYCITKGRLPLEIDPVQMLTVAADHGVALQAVSPFPQAVTRQMVKNFLNNGAAINVLCSTFNISLKIVDAGCAGGPFPPHPGLLDRRMGDGTKDLATTEAMSPAQCRQALLSGFKLGLECANSSHLLALGEMGIANSTSASALYCAYLGLSPEQVAGPGAGAGPSMLAHKREVIARALKIHSKTIKSGDPEKILAALGGFEIAMLAGIMLSCAAASLPFLVDGFICTAALLAATRIYPPLRDYAFLAHTSAEPAYSLAVSGLEGSPKPLLDLSMRLGEGTGCAMAVPILRASCAIFNSMATMAEAGVSATREDRLD